MSHRSLASWITRIVACACALAVSACDIGGGPGAVLEEWAEAMSDRDYDAASQLCFLSDPYGLDEDPKDALAAGRARWADTKRRMDQDPNVIAFRKACRMYQEIDDLEVLDVDGGAVKARVRYKQCEGEDAEDERTFSLGQYPKFADGWLVNSC